MYIVSTLPVIEPISTADAKAHLIVEHAEDDAYIDLLVSAARRFVETLFELALNTQTVTEYFEDFTSDDLVLTVYPVITVNSVKYYDEDGVQQTLDISKYNAHVHGFSPLVELKDGETWPTLEKRSRAVEIQYDAGFGAAATDIPENIIHALKLMVGSSYEGREDKVHKMPVASDRLLSPFVRSRA